MSLEKNIAIAKKIDLVVRFRQFLNDARNKYVKNKDQSLVTDILEEIKGKNPAQLRKYFYSKIRKAEGQEFNGIPLKEEYAALFVNFLELQVNYDPIKDQPDDTARWLLKRISSRANEYEITAYNRILQKVWYTGGLSAKVKKRVMSHLRLIKGDITQYGHLSKA